MWQPVSGRLSANVARCHAKRFGSLNGSPAVLDSLQQHTSVGQISDKLPVLMDKRSPAHRSVFRICLAETPSPNVFNLISNASCILMKEGALDLNINRKTASKGPAPHLADFRAFTTNRHTLYIEGPNKQMEARRCFVCVECCHFVPGELAYINLAEDLAVVLVRKSLLPPAVLEIEGVGLATTQLTYGDRLDIFGYPAGSHQGLWANRTDGVISNLPGNVQFCNPTDVASRYEINGDVHRGNSGQSCM